MRAVTKEETAEGMGSRREMEKERWRRGRQSRRGRGGRGRPASS
jgi:hypothetical protein